MSKDYSGPPYSKVEMHQLEQSRMRYRNQDQPKFEPKPPTLGGGAAVQNHHAAKLAAAQKDFQNARRIEETKVALKAREGHAREAFSLAKEKGRATTDFNR